MVDCPITVTGAGSTAAWVLDVGIGVGIGGTVALFSLCVLVAIRHRRGRKRNSVPSDAWHNASAAGQPPSPSASFSAATRRRANGWVGSSEDDGLGGGGRARRIGVALAKGPRHTTLSAPSAIASGPEAGSSLDGGTAVAAASEIPPPPLLPPPLLWAKIPQLPSSHSSGLGAFFDRLLPRGGGGTQQLSIRQRSYSVGGDPHQQQQQRGGSDGNGGHRRRGSTGEGSAATAVAVGGSVGRLSDSAVPVGLLASPSIMLRLQSDNGSEGALADTAVMGDAPPSQVEVVNGSHAWEEVRGRDRGCRLGGYLVGQEQWNNL